MQMLESLAGMMMIITEATAGIWVGCSDQTASPDWRFSQIADRYSQPKMALSSAVTIHARKVAKAARIIV